MIEFQIPPSRKGAFVAAAEIPVFPIPKSGQTQIIPTSAGTFDVKCTGINHVDNDRLLGFFCNMGGHVKDFRFQYRDVVHQKCRFDSSEVSFEDKGGRNNVVLPIKILK